MNMSQEDLHKGYELIHSYQDFIHHTLERMYSPDGMENPSYQAIKEVDAEIIYNMLQRIDMISVGFAQGMSLDEIVLHMHDINTRYDALCSVMHDISKVAQELPVPEQYGNLAFVLHPGERKEVIDSIDEMKQQIADSLTAIQAEHQHSDMTAPSSQALTKVLMERVYNSSQQVNMMHSALAQGGLMQEQMQFMDQLQARSYDICVTLNQMANVILEPLSNPLPPAQQQPQHILAGAAERVHTTASSSPTIQI